MKKALVVGVDYYAKAAPLFGCVNDAHAVKSVMDRNSDGTKNFDVKILTGTGPSDPVNRAELRDNVRSLFEHTGEIALLYFAGHGHVEATGGYLLGSDAATGDEGLPLGEVLAMANASKSQNRIILLDSCHSGIAGGHPSHPSLAELSQGMTILTASTAEGYAAEERGAGVFTALLIDALSGAAGNLLGQVTPGAVYAHIDQSLGSWAQRPVFKTNVERFVSLRQVQPPIDLADLHRLTEFFPDPGTEFALDPAFEPERDVQAQAGLPPPDPQKTAIFKVLQKMNRVNLVVPVDAPHMWHAAMDSKGCRLTVLGEHYRRLVHEGLI
jgi:hypothetical protein